MPHPEPEPTTIAAMRAGGVGAAAAQAFERHTSDALSPVAQLVAANAALLARLAAPRRDARGAAR